VSTYASILSRREAGVAGCPCIPAFSTHEEEVGEARGLSILSFQHNGDSSIDMVLTDHERVHTFLFIYFLNHTVSKLFSL
jgi:hypothetical protein